MYDLDRTDSGEKKAGISKCANQEHDVLMQKMDANEEGGALTQFLLHPRDLTLQSRQIR